MQKIEELRKLAERDINDQLEEIFIKETFSVLKRRKKIVSFFIASGFVISGFISLLSVKTWRGEFQIVLNKDKNLSPAEAMLKNSDLDLASLVNVGNNNKELKTEVGILKSPSILMEIFEFVKNEKLSKNRSKKEIRYDKWNKQLSIRLEKDTTILKINYDDKDKSLILPVLNKISNAYQNYSGKSRRRQIELGLNFFEKQIKIFKIKSVESLRAAQQFAIEQDLSIIEDEALIDKEIVNFINIEKIRVESANRIRLIDQQLEQIKKLEDKSDEIMYFASTIDSLDELTEKLKTIESRISRYKLTYKDEDKSIQDLQKEKSFLINLLKRQVKGFLMAAKDDEKAKLKAAERPEGVLIEYRQLLTNAGKDKATLDRLEDQNRILLLEKARSDDPWKLISTPTILPEPIAPRSLRLIFFGLFSGFLIGWIASIIEDKRKGIIYSRNKLISLWGNTFISELKIKNAKDWEDYLNLLKVSILSNNNESIAILILNNFKQSNKNFIEEKLFNNKISITSKTENAFQANNIIILIELGITKIEDILNLKEKLILQNKKNLLFLILKDIY